LEKVLVTCWNTVTIFKQVIVPYFHKPRERLLIQYCQQVLYNPFPYCCPDLHTGDPGFCNTFQHTQQKLFPVPQHSTLKKPTHT